MKPLEITRHDYPVEPAGQQVLIDLWRCEWTRTDYDWLQALHGDYSDTLSIVSVIARRDGQPVATATVCFAKTSPEVCLIGNVLTRAACRGQGIGVAVTESAVACGFRAGCQVAYLGSSRLQGNLYERCGFTRLAGSIMRRAAPDHSDCEVEFFATEQKSEIRPAVWGDMPSFVNLLAQPLESVVIDSPRGLLSIRHADPVRCVSAFAVVHDEIQQRGGAMLILAAVAGSRVFGFGTLTPGPAPGSRHRAVVDVAVHPHYSLHLDDIIEQLRQEAISRNLEVLQACTAVSDTTKIAALIRAGFQPIVELPGQLRLRCGMVETVLLESRP